MNDVRKKGHKKSILKSFLKSHVWPHLDFLSAQIKHNLL
jgi:hypothetical protein